ncbi:hypothetical protein RCL1_005452 [Eukaryota sp. TZLM3-RCL]
MHWCGMYARSLAFLWPSIPTMDPKSSNSVPHYSQSNGLVERRHQDILQNLRKLLIDFNDYDNWSSYIPLVQLLTNAAPHAATGHTPYELMFGSAFSPRSDPSCILKAINSVESKCTFLQEYKLKLDRINQKREEARANQIAKQPTPPAKQPNPFKIGDLVLRFDKSSNKLHGSFSGPHLVVDVPTQSTITIQNIISGSRSSASIKMCRPYHSDLPPITTSTWQSHLVTQRNTSSHVSCRPVIPLPVLCLLSNDSVAKPLRSP